MWSMEGERQAQGLWNRKGNRGRLVGQFLQDGVPSVGPQWMSRTSLPERKSGGHSRQGVIPGAWG